MIGSQATRAIAVERLVRQKGSILFLICASALLAALQRHSGIEAQIMGAAFFGSLGALYLVLGQHGGRFSELDLCEQSAPLYGRELARARALVACIGVTLAIAAYWIVGVFSPGPHAVAVLISLGCANAAALFALDATIQTGARRAITLTVTAICVIAIVWLGFIQPPAALFCCFFVGFTGLRRYGEGLARYDPIPS